MTSDPKKFYDLPRPGEYWSGRVVSKVEDDRRWYGHIVRFSRTILGEVAVVVIWEGREEDIVHHGNIDLH